MGKERRLRETAETYEAAQVALARLQRQVISQSRDVTDLEGALRPPLALTWTRPVGSVERTCYSPRITGFRRMCAGAR
jgi:hypothetical protein